MVKIGVVGASGYTGVEIVRLLSNHSKAELAYISSSTYQEKKISEVYSNLKGVCNLSFSGYNVAEIAEKTEVVFVALPHGRSMEVVPSLLEVGLKVIDLSNDFRLSSAETYEYWHEHSHVAPNLIGKAVYGLPEIYQKKIEESPFVSNPGCYPTSVLLATAPLLREDLIFEEKIIVDSLSGVSGVGRKLDHRVHYCKCDDNISSYKVGGAHQHIPEMEQEMSKLSGGEVKISFTPHLVPLSRGIYSTIYADLKKALSTSKLHEILENFYKAAYFVQVLEEGEFPELKAVTGSNFCHIGLKVDQRMGRAIIISALDNLVKGASGQAIQNMNLMCGFSEEEGLRSAGLLP